MIKDVVFVLRAANDPPGSAVTGAKKATMQVLLGPDDGVPRFILRRFTLPAGDRIPRHRHDSVEHVQMVLEGEMTLEIDGVPTVARKDDCMFIPAGISHAYENRSSDDCRFLCIVPRTEHYHTEWLDETLK